MNEFETIRVIGELLVTGLAAVLFWNFRTLKTEVGQLDAAVLAVNMDLQAYKLHAAEHYATSSDMKNLIDAVFKKLDRIEDKLDKKADKI